MGSPSLPEQHQTCPACGADAVGKFCSHCGASLTAGSCAACGAPLSPGAKFCHRCGSPAGAADARSSEQRSFSSALPWGVAAIALVAMVALVAGQRFGRTSSGAPSGVPDNAAEAMSANAPNAPFAGATGNGAAPDISNLTPAEAAVRLYNRVMEAHEEGKADTVQMFAPMAITAYQMIGNLNLDERYDMGRIAAVSGNEQLARAEADTILAKYPNHLLGLILAENAAHLRKDTAAERKYYDALQKAAPSERGKQLEEYVTHENDITIALDARRP